MDIINYYVDILLKTQLESYGLLNNSIILNDVKIKMTSLLNQWKDIEFRNAILITGMEESEFYEPNANSYLKAFVVLTIRNTFLESAGSKFYKNYDFEVQISDIQMKEITKKALIYFKQYSLDEICLSINCSDDYYCRVSEKYPIAFELLKKLGTLKKREIYFEPISIGEKTVFLPYVNPNVEIDDKEVIEDGIVLHFDEKLILSLMLAVKCKERGFFVDCFKYLTRNYEKLLKVIQYLIENNSTFCTFNYYISNGYITKRNNLLRASHYPEEIIPKFIKNGEVTSKHKKCLEMWKKLYLKKNKEVKSS